MAKVQALAQAVQANVAQVVIGKAQVVERMLVALLAKGHILLEDVPGTGKTLLAKALAQSLGLSFSRIQFTPDLLPSDVTGINYFNQKLTDFEYRPGPLNAQVVLADEINRATPRTQSALLEAMGEVQVTVDGQSRPLPTPFLVLATQNPVEQEGTFPLPEAQLDRFLLRLALGYPSRDEEKAILDLHGAAKGDQPLAPVATEAAIEGAQAEVQQIHVSDAVKGYLLDLIAATREHEAIVLGVSPRGSLALLRAAQALAAIRGRTFVLPDDIQELALPVWAHRLVLRPHERLRGAGAEGVLAEILESVPAPVEATP